MARTIETLLRENLHGVFGEHDIQKRQSNIARLWAEDGVFIDHKPATRDIRPVRDREIAGSNPAFPTTHIDNPLVATSDPTTTPDATSQYARRTVHSRVSRICARRATRWACSGRR